MYQQAKECVPFQPEITQYDLDRIEFRVGWLVRHFRLTADDADDLRQSMALEICKALRRFDPKKSARNTYVNRTLDRYYRHVTRQIRSHRSHAAWCPASLTNIRSFPSLRSYSSNGRIDDFELVDLRHDVAAIVLTLPPRLQRIAAALMLLKPREAAAQLGLHPSTIYRAIGELRDHFAQAEWDGQRQSRGACRCR